jgi:hypothetical protein
MTDWNMITENIRLAMQALDEAQHAREKLLAVPTSDQFDAFRLQMQELTERMNQLQTILNDEKAYAVDELNDWLSQALAGHHAEYRRTSHMKSDK